MVHGTDENETVMRFIRPALYNKFIPTNVLMETIRSLP